MRSNVGSCVKATHDQVERFAECWSQLKPKDEVMEADSCVCVHCQGQESRVAATDDRVGET